MRGSGLPPDPDRGRQGGTGGQGGPRDLRRHRSGGRHGSLRRDRPRRGEERRRAGQARRRADPGRRRHHPDTHLPRRPLVGASVIRRIAGLALLLLVGPLLPALPAHADEPVVNGRIAFTGMAGIGVVSPDGVNPHDISTAAGGENPAWSPDGGRIAFQTSADGDFDIRSVPADGSGSSTPLTFGAANDIDPAYSPDGTR